MKTLLRRIAAAALAAPLPLADAQTWTQATPSASPPARGRLAMAHDLARDRTVMFGGGDGLAVRADTWEYDGSTWTQVTSPSAPLGRVDHALAYDVNRGRIVLFGGGPFSFNVLGDTWEYDGANGVWIQLPIPSAAAPPARASHGLVYDGTRARVTLFGGRVGFPTGAELADTWELLAPAAPTWTRHGLGCAGSSGVPSLDPPANATPALGTLFPLQLTSLPPQPGMFMIGFGFGVEDYQGAPLPMSLSTRGLPGCQMWVTSADINWLLPHGGVAATFPLQIPPDPWLAGLLVGTQAMVLDPGAPNGAGSVTNGGILVVN